MEEYKEPFKVRAKRELTWAAGKATVAIKAALPKAKKAFFKAAKGKSGITLWDKGQKHPAFGMFPKGRKIELI